MAVSAVISYTELVRRVPIGEFAENTDLVAEMPAIIRQAEDTLYGRIDHDWLQTTLTGKTVGAAPPPNLSGTSDILDLSAESPALLEIRGISIQYKTAAEYTPLERRSAEYLRMLYSRNRPGRPRFYCDDGHLKYRVFPFPAQLFTLKVTANVKLPYLAVTTQETNRFTTDTPRAIDRACMYHAAIFMKDMQAASVYEKEMDAALLESNLLAARRRRDETDQRPRETANAQGA